MGLLKNSAAMLGELSRISRTAKDEEKNMTPELQHKLTDYINRANAGDVDAMTTLADAYWKGTLLRYDPHEACKWWTMAAEAGHVSSMYNLGILYMGDISKQFYDDKMASYWLCQASVHGDQEAGKILEKNYKYSSLFKKWNRR